MRNFNATAWDMSMADNETSRIETEWAYLAQNGDTRDKCWLPKSCLIEA